MSPKQIVKVFDEQDVCFHLKSKAILLQKTFENAEIETWLVKILKTGKEEQHYFYKDRLKHYLI